jgi:DNA repair protein RadD
VLNLDEIAEELVTAVLARGELSKLEVMETWSVDDSGYRAIQKLVANRSELIEPGPPRIGGFRAAIRKGKLPNESESEDLVQSASWEVTAVERMSELLEHKELEQLLGTLVSPLRQLRKEKTGTDRRGTKRELATALVLRHGVDLFAEKEVRTMVAKRAGVSAPDRWKPGKAKAICFTLDARFPPELAGIPSPDAPPDYEYLEGATVLKPLLAFQEEVKRGLYETLLVPGRRAIVTLPTGGGKTRVAVESIRDWLTSRYDVASRSSTASAVLWLAHTEELCEQAYACFKEVWDASADVCPLLLVRFWGGHTQDLVEHRETLHQVLARPSVLVSTPQRIVNLLEGAIAHSEAVAADLRDALGLIVIDEAHRAAAPSYSTILNGLIQAERPASVVGLTATPFRMEYLGDDPEEGTRELKEIFGRLIEPIETLGESPRLKLQDDRVLARPIPGTIKTPTTISVPATAPGPEDEGYERIDRVLKLKADNGPRRLAILRELVPIANNPQHSILYFGPSVSDAECMAFLLRAEGVSAAVVTGATRTATRRNVINEFKPGRIRVLCNCEVLTTGFDAPRVTHVVMARPTISRVLYEQMVGRALRGPKFGGTETCVILDCEDNFRGEKPHLGYESFRHVWERETRRSRARAMEQA